jgi:succinate-semialdehyde dehydrogenase/glutarate-semialdehyde dehydrogenase
MNDVNATKVAHLSVGMKFRNAGQMCNSPSRFYVQKGVFGEFVDAFSERARAIKIGSGLDETTTMGPLANSRRLEAIKALTRQAADQGAELVCGGHHSGNRGHFFEPTVVIGAKVDTPIMREEIFGPVAPVVEFNELEEALAQANSTKYGLAAYAFTSSAVTADILYKELRAGAVGINNYAVTSPEVPFGGIDESGYGSEGGSEGLESYLVAKMVAKGIDGVL